MYQFKYAKRTELNSFWSGELMSYLTKNDLSLGWVNPPANAELVIRQDPDRWYRVSLPAGVIALAFKGPQGHQVGYYHSPSEAELELKAIINEYSGTKASK